MGVESDWHLYLIRCRRGSLYAGITTDVERRFAEHVRGGPQAARYLRGKGPLELVYRTTVGTRAQASVLESRVKKLPREQKLRLIAGELTIASLGWAAPAPAAQGERDDEQSH
jgi:putative endonuclease